MNSFVNLFVKLGNFQKPENNKQSQDPCSVKGNYKTDRKNQKHQKVDEHFFLYEIVFEHFPYLFVICYFMEHRVGSDKDLIDEVDQEEDKEDNVHG